MFDEFIFTCTDWKVGVLHDAWVEPVECVESVECVTWNVRRTLLSHLNIPHVSDARRVTVCGAKLECVQRRLPWWVGVGHCTDTRVGND